MAEDSISNDDDASEMGAEWWGARLSKFIASIFAQSNSTSTANSTTTMMDIQQQPPPPIIDAQPVPVPAKPSTTNAVNNDWLHFCIMVLLEGKHGKNVHILCTSYSYAYLMYSNPNSTYIYLSTYTIYLSSRLYKELSVSEFLTILC
jgi:hypothetical protein